MGKVITQDDLIFRRADWKRGGQRVVFASGAFDLLHPGHVRLLEQARSLGDVLIVGVESDRAVRERHVSDKGATRTPRPITLAAERAEILAAFAAVDYVVELDGAAPGAGSIGATTARELAAHLLPDIVVRGGDITSKHAPAGEVEAIEAAGGRIVRIPLEPGHSTAGLIERIAQLPA